LNPPQKINGLRHFQSTAQRAYHHAEWTIQQSSSGLIIVFRIVKYRKRYQRRNFNYKGIIMIFYKHLSKFSFPENEFLEDILNSNKRLWFTAKTEKNYELKFVRDKKDCEFYLARIKNFPRILRSVCYYIPDTIIENSYVTKCSPGRAMEKHIDPNRKTAIVIPLGKNKGILNYYYKNFKISTCEYKGPTLTRVDMIHSAVNTSEEYRYSITIEIPGSYFKNFFKYN
jgi:hypothetical protein